MEYFVHLAGCAIATEVKTVSARRKDVRLGFIGRPKSGEAGPKTCPFRGSSCRGGLLGPNPFVEAVELCGFRVKFGVTTATGPGAIRIMGKRRPGRGGEGLRFHGMLGEIALDKKAVRRRLR
jgi:hypothetical protein